MSALPEWMNSNFFDEVLQKNHSTTELISYNVRDSGEKTYNGGIYRGFITYMDALEETVNLPLFIKTISRNELVTNFLKSMDVYAKEIDFYENIVPKLNTILREFDPDIFPQTLYTCKTTPVLVLEDLSVEGYSMPSIRPGIDVETTQGILRKLASFHAASAVLHQQQPNIFENFQHGFINRTGFDTMVIHSTQLNAVIDALATWPNFESYHEKLLAFKSRFEEKARTAYEPRENQFNTLNHGDLWTANVMLNGNDFKLIDFQSAFWTSPAVDLQLLLNSSLEFSIHTKCINEFVNYYHSHLVEALQRLDYQKNIPTFDEFMNDFNDRSICGFMSSCLILPEVHVDHDDVDVEIYLSDTEQARQFKRSILDAPIAQQIIQFFVPYYDRLGVFD